MAKLARPQKAGSSCVLCVEWKGWYPEGTAYDGFLSQTHLFTGQEAWLDCHQKQVFQQLVYKHVCCPWLIHQ